MFESTKIKGANRPYILPRSRRACDRYRRQDIRIARPVGRSLASSPYCPQARPGAPGGALVGPILQLTCDGTARRAGSLDIQDLEESPVAAYSCGEYILLISMSQLKASFCCTLQVTPWLAPSFATVAVPC